MDPLSSAASLISILQSSRAMLKTLLRYGIGLNASPAFQRQVTKFEAYTALLESIRVRASSPSVSPDALGAYVRLCHDSLEETQHYLSKSASSKIKMLSMDTDKIEKALGNFMEAVQLLKVFLDGFYYDWMVETLSEIHTEHGRRLRNIELQIEFLRSVTTEDNTYSREQLHAALENLANSLQASAMDNPKWQPNTSDPFSFSATIICAHEDDAEHTVARGMLDSGCDKDWISLEVIKRAGIEAEMAPVENPITYTAFGGQEFQPIGMIDVTWYALNANLSRKTTFLVHDAVPFDMVLGKVFIKEESIFVFNKPALALRQARFTKEELREIEANAREKNATNEQIASIRRADDASSRDRLRQQKAASRLTTPRTMSLSPRSVLGQSPTAGSSLSRTLSVRSSQSLPPQLTQTMSRSQTNEPRMSHLSTLGNSEMVSEATP